MRRKQNNRTRKSQHTSCKEEINLDDDDDDDDGGGDEDKVLQE